LTGWTLVAVGNTVNIFTWTLSGTIQPGDALVVGDQTLTVSFPVDFPAESWSTSNSTWNGNVGDGAKLYNGATLIDYVVVDATRFENMDYVRNAGVTSPSTTYISSQWTGTAIDYPTQGTPGTHGAPPPTGPAISNVVTDPASPLVGQTVNLEADVTDGVATITSVVAHWGTSSGTLPNTITMSLQSGSTYRTSSAIPAQAGGSTVYYTIEAANNLPASTISPQASYSLGTPVSIYAIQGQASVSPYAGSSVMTSGVVTAAYGTTYVLQDAAAAWHGLWVVGASAPAVGDTVIVQGTVTEAYGSGLDGNTVLSGATVLSAAPAVSPPAPIALTTIATVSEAYEGVLVAVSNAQCTTVDLGAGEWAANDGSGVARIGERGYDSTPIRGTRYNVKGPLGYSNGQFKLEPRSAADIVWVGDTFAPLILEAAAEGLTSVRIDFSEPLEPTTAGSKNYYSIAGLTVLTAQVVPGVPDQVLLGVSTMGTATYTVSITGVQDPYGNAMVGATHSFDVSAYSPPAGYYASAEGLDGQELRMALHLIIDNHTVKSYDYALIAFYTTDDKPNGKVWDMYSDVPGGTPPYEYTFGVDAGGSASGEGDGYNREHSWPKSWFGDASPMYSDLFQLYPTDIYVNGIRSNYPYGEVSSPTYTSQNGCKRGPNTYPGYTGTVFEPIDAYKGDFARTYFYMTARYYTEDGGWPGSDMTDGCTLLPWAQDMLIEWHLQDPVSEKERERNQVIYGFQGNRNPFIDRPDFVAAMYGLQSGVGDSGRPSLHALQNMPNPFFAGTTITFELPGESDAAILVYDLQGRLVKEILSERLPAGAHRVIWDGRDASGRPAAGGVYFYSIQTDRGIEARRMVLVR
jgi:endonuclease I